MPDEKEKTPLTECRINCGNWEKGTIVNEIGDFPIEIVDVEERHWKNSEDTLVFRIKDKLDFETMVNFSDLIHDLRPDEFDIMWIDGTPYFRLWWD